MMDAFMVSVGQYVAQRRNQLRLTQEELAQRLNDRGIPRKATTIANWETGRVDVPLDVLNALATALEEPSPAKLYDLAGVLDQLPGGAIVRILDEASPAEIQRIERMIRAYVKDTKND